MNRLLLLLLAGCITLTAAPLCAQDASETEAQLTPPAEPAAEVEAIEPETSAIGDLIDPIFTRINGVLAAVLFRSVTPEGWTVDQVDRDGNPIIDPETGEQGKTRIEIPFIVLVLAFGAIFFTIWFRFINVRGFKHSIDVIRGKFDNPEDEGEISHFRALTSALSATVGLGNIGGVAVAIQLGGPGAVFWMWVMALFGMTAKFSSCTLSQLYRKVNPDGTISGGPMYYLDLGLKAKGGFWAPLGKVLAVMYAFMVMGGAFGGGNLFQSNQSFEALYSTFDVIKSDQHDWIFGLVMSVLVGLVIIGGIKRIGAATSKIVPAMCGIYVLASVYIIMQNLPKVPETFALIVQMAFTKNAYLGGAVYVMVQGIRRAAFSNEAGLGSAAIAHAAAKTDEPVREGIVAMIGPFIDTIVICTMTALVVIITGAWEDPSIPKSAGVALTTAAFGSAISWFPYVLTACIVLFAYSTMISWCYYGERGWIYLLDHLGEGVGLRSVIIFRIVFLSFTFLGAVTSLGAVIDFSDMMILAMAFPNIVGSVILAPLVLVKVKDYWSRYTSGAMARRP